MKTYKEAIRKLAKGVVAGMFSGGSRYAEYQVVNTVAWAYEVSSSTVEADIQKLLDSPKFMREAKGC